MKKSIDKSRLNLGTVGDESDRVRGVRRDRRRLIAMGVGLVALMIAFVISRFQADKYRADSKQLLPVTPEVVERVELPEIDVTRLDGLVSDSSAEDRVLLERAAVDELLGTTRNLTAAHFEALEAVLLDTTNVDALLVSPAASRGKAFTARGWITSLRTRKPGGGRPDETHGRMVLDGGRSVYFIARKTPEGLGTDEYARVDGLFLKAFNDEDPSAPGTWIQGPLLVAPELTRSYSPLGDVSSLSPGVFIDVTDDDVEGGITGLPTRPLWTLLAYARDHAPDAVDWESVRELDMPSVNEMLADGSKWRLEPFRLPPTQLMGVWIRRPGENPARMEEVTEGWIGSWTWTGEAKVLRFMLPRPRSDLKEGDLVTGRGYFFKNLAYAPSAGGMRLASMVVMEDLTKFIPTENKSVQQIWIGVIVAVVGLAVVMTVLLIRDQRRSKRIAENLIERRRKRRAQRQGTTGATGAGGATAPPSST
jgi:hypothetical protein